MKEIRDDPAFDPREPCKTGFRNVEGVDVEYDYETGEEVPLDYNPDGQTEGMRGLNGNSGSNNAIDDYYDSMVQMMDMFDQAYGGQALENAANKADNGDSVGRNDATGDIAVSSVAADNMF